jgi:hypothetical protein
MKQREVLIAMLAYGLNERMARKAEYLREENRVLKEALRAATGKSLLDPVDGLLRKATHLIHDRAPLFTAPSALLAGARTVYLREKLQRAGPSHSGSRRRGERCSSPEA